MPSFEDKYPELYAQTQGDITAAFADNIYAAVQDHFVADISMLVDLSLNTTVLLKAINRMRQDNGLEAVPTELCHEVKDHVKVKAQAAYYAAHGFPEVDIQLPPVDVGPGMSVHDVFQKCYDQTKTEDFYDAIRAVPNPEPLIYAITMWHEHHESQRTKDFLIEIARDLYTKSMAHVEINVKF